MKTREDPVSSPVPLPWPCPGPTGQVRGWSGLKRLTLSAVLVLVQGSDMSVRRQRAGGGERDAASVLRRRVVGACAGECESRTLALVRCLWCYVPAVWAPRWLSWACSHCPLAVFVSFPLSRWPVFVPSAVRSIQIVRYARARGCKVKVVGSGHSFSHAAAVADDGIILDISGLSGVLGVDRARRRITVEAGMTVAVHRGQQFLGAH